MRGLGPVYVAKPTALAVVTQTSVAKMAAGQVADARHSLVDEEERRRVGANRVDEEQRMTTPTAPSTTPRIDPDPLSPLNQMQRYLVHEFVEDYQDGLLSRRDLMTKLGYIAGGATAAAAILT